MLIKSCVVVLITSCVFIFSENVPEATDTISNHNPLTSSISAEAQVQRKKREVQLSTDLDEHTSLAFETSTEEKILYISLALGVILTFTCCCVCWKYCFCDVTQNRTIIYQQMPASQIQSVIHGQVTLQTFPPIVTTVNSSDLQNLIPMTSYSSNKQEIRDADGQYLHRSPRSAL